MKIKQELKQKVLDYTYKFYDDGYSTSLDSGDISIRDPETNLIYTDPRPSDTLKIVNWRSINIDDIIVCDMDGNIIEANPDRYPTIELPMHIYIYKARPEIYSIVHTHSTYSQIFAAAGWDIPACLAETVKYAKGDIKCAEYGAPSTELLAANVVKALGDRNAALMRCHGAVGVGRDIEEAFSVVEYTERAAYVSAMAMAMGAKVLRPGE